MLNYCLVDLFSVIAVILSLANKLIGLKEMQVPSCIFEFLLVLWVCIEIISNIYLSNCIWY